MAQQLSETQANLQCSQILELPDLFDLIKVSTVDDFGDDASFTMEDLMGMGDKAKYENSPTYEIDTSRSHDKFVLGGSKERKKYQMYLASCPEFNFEETKTTNSPRKHKSSKKTKKTREAPSRTSSCTAAIQRGNTLIRPKKELREARALPSRSFSCMATFQTGEVKKTSLSRQKKERRKSHDDPLLPLHSSFSLADVEEEVQIGRRRGALINAHQVEFGRSFSSIAHASGLHKKIDKNDESFSDVLDKVAEWKKTTKRDDRLSMRATRSIDIDMEEEEDVKQVSKEEVSDLKRNAKREKTALACTRERSSGKERWSGKKRLSLKERSAEIPFETQYRRKKSLRNMGGSLRNIFAGSSGDPSRKKISLRTKSRGSSRNVRTQPSVNSKPPSCKADLAEPLPPKQEIDNYLGQAFVRHLSRQLSKSQSAF